VGKYYQVALNRCVQNSLAASTIIMIESYLHRWLDSYCRYIDRIVVPSRFFIDKFVEWGWSKRLFTHIPNFVDASHFRPAFVPGKYFVYFGRLSFEKGVATLIRAAAAAGVQLKLVGSGPAEAELRTLAEDLGAPVGFVGYCTGNELHEIVRRSRAAVLPSECYENAPISILESFALGKPVVGTRIGGIPEMVRQKETGWQFQSGNVEELASILAEVANKADPDISELGRNARRLVEKEFNRERYVRATLDVYRDLGVSGTVGTESLPQ
jgi:glycosyltransferase involved in cell wall biosynthesis